jgi:tetratricopeptide (TPR) repeat protein
MTKYRIRLRNGRVIGPFLIEQLYELKAKGHILGNEEAQTFPTGQWQPLSTFEFYEGLMDPNKTTVLSSANKEETFVIDLSKLRNQKNEKELESLDVSAHQPIIELTETIRIVQSAENKNSKSRLDVSQDDDSEQKLMNQINQEDDQHDKTALNPIAQQDIERLRKLKAQNQKKLEEDEEKKRLALIEAQKVQEEQKLIEADESTQMFKLDSVRQDLMLIAQSEEEKFEIEEKEIKKKIKEKEKLEEEVDTNDDEDELKNKKKKKVFIFLGVLALIYALLNPNEEKSEKLPFKHLEPVIEFPIPFDKADLKRSKIEFNKALTFFSKGDYPNIVKAGILLKSSYENNIDDEEVLSLLVRSYAEQLKYSKEDKQTNAQVIFNMIQAKRPFLVKDPNGVIGLNLFYMAINKPEAAADVIARYLKIYPKNVTTDLFAVYLLSLLKLGRIDLAQQFNAALEKAPKKNRYTYDALIEYARLNQNSDKEIEYTTKGIADYPELVGFYLKKADQMIKQRNIKEAESLLSKADDLNLEHNNTNRAQYLYLKGLTIAYKGDASTATSYFVKSLQIEDSNEIRTKLADLSSSGDTKSETNRLIEESKAIKLTMQAKDFLEKKSYELALSYAARSADLLPGYIPSELFLAKVQLKLGLAKQALKNLESLIQKYPDDRSINLALVDAYIETYKFNDAKNRIGIISGTNLKHSYEFASANGRLYMRMGDPLLAMTWFRTSINMNPLNDQDIFYLSELFIKRAKFEEATLLLNKCIELDPVNPDYRIAYAKVVYEQQDDTAAIGYLLGLMEEFGENPKILAEIAIFYYRAGKVKDFEAYKQKLEKFHTKDKSLYEFLLKAALLDERYSEIPNLVENLLIIEPGNLEAMMTAGRVLFENGKLAEAAKWFKRIQEKLDSYPKVQYYIAKIKYLARDYDNALKDVEADLKANGDNDADLTLMAQIYVEKGDLVQAENLFKRSQKINPKSFESLMGLADISTKRNNFDLALDLYKRAMREKADESVVHRKIGDVYRLLGQGVLAVESYKLYLEMNPEASDKGQIESYINLMQ